MIRGLCLQNEPVLLNLEQLRLVFWTYENTEPFCFAVFLQGINMFKLIFTKLLVLAVFAISVSEGKW